MVRLLTILATLLQLLLAVLVLKTQTEITQFLELSPQSRVVKAEKVAVSMEPLADQVVAVILFQVLAVDLLQDKVRRVDRLAQPVETLAVVAVVAQVVQAVQQVLDRQQQAQAVLVYHFQFLDQV
jgi:hypothetical protein